MMPSVYSTPMLPPLGPVFFAASPTVSSAQPVDRLEIRFGKRNMAHYRKLAAHTTATRNGYGISGRINFQLTTKAKLDYNEIRLIQELKGYHPLGYDFFGPSTPQPGKGDKYTYKWACAASCD